ncbi:hypothetical protein D2926_18295 [Vibrio cholerae]|nr:hypothetical protein [Vibrio cholerae]TLE19596.1 hypothetical protein D2926_18295 [Vibrio cholerae]TLE26754.1 hypothetical protein D2927_18285 [Vibrio cholerae]TLE29793.1 hypothetical protein D2928_18375 [Vibrio cholerae]TLE40798.1 hypothetical protein D2929_18475 [Vibrio cholerae]
MALGVCLSDAFA